MCLVLIAYRQLPETPLLVAANRDEFHARPTAALHWWPDTPGILAGRDLEAGGTWLGMSRNGRFACVTNYRDAVPPGTGLRSRGELITRFLEAQATPREFLANLDGERYAGFNLFVADGQTLAYGNNQGAEPRELRNGIYALANASLDVPWHKTRIARTSLQNLVAAGAADSGRLFEVLGDRQTAPAGAAAKEHPQSTRAEALSAPFIVQPDYGTRSSTTVLVTANGDVEITERRYAPDGVAEGENRQEFRIEPR
ncbi:MAG: NRDE family protein [Pseudomonadota bacterium]